MERAEDAKYGHRTGDKQQKKRNRQCRKNCPAKHSRPCQQSQQEEDENLHQAGDAVEKADKGLFAAEFFITQHHSDYVGAQVAVAAEDIRNRIGRDGDREHEEGVVADSRSGRIEF